MTPNVVIVVADDMGYGDLSLSTTAAVARLTSMR